MKKLLILCLCLLTLVGCSKGTTETTATTKAQTTAKPMVTTAKPTEKPTEPTTVKNLPIHPLTGLPTESDPSFLKRKPVAIMMGNSKDALPQLGLSQADIIIEMMAEGGTTRLMCLWQDPSNMKRIGSIRSARPYFIDMAQGFDAYFMHFGGSVPAYEAISKRKDLVNLDGIRGGYEGSLYVRDPDRRKHFALEHTVVTSGERIEKTLAKFKNTDKKNEDFVAFNFDKNHSALKGTTRQKVTINYFTMNQPYFVFNEKTSTYDRYQHKKPHYDGEYDKNVSVKNVFILEMPFQPVKGDPLKIVEVHTTGSGNGKYFCDGKYLDIKWSKKAYNAPLVLTDLEGNPLKVAPGQSFICTIKTGGKITIE